MSDSSVLGLLNAGVRHVAVYCVGPGVGLVLRLLSGVNDGPLGAGDGGCEAGIDCGVRR